MFALAAAGAFVAWFQSQPAQPRPAPEPPARSVVLAEARAVRLTREVTAIGSAVATESVTLSAEITGRVAAIRFEEGARVEAGEPLFVLDPGPVEDEARATAAELAELEQQLDRGSRLARSGYAPRGDVEDLRRRLDAARARLAAAEARLERTRILAPFAGRVGLREVSPGALVQPGTPLVPLDALDPMDIRFTIPEREAGRVREGAAVTARSDALQGQLFRGEVRVIGTRVDPALRTLTVVARVPNPEQELRPGMLLHVSVAAEVVEQAVTVPPRAVQVRGAEHAVFRAEDGVVRRTPVRIGSRTPERIEILEGLQPGARVVVEGLQELEDGARIREAEPPRVAAR